MSKDPALAKGSDNHFEDVSLPDVDANLIKAVPAALISAILRERPLT